MSPVPSTTLVTRNPDLVAPDIEGDLVMMSIEQADMQGFVEQLIQPGLAATA